jgi:outer membrane protein insertion porin family
MSVSRNQWVALNSCAKAIGLSFGTFKYACIICLALVLGSSTLLAQEQSTDQPQKTAPQVQQVLPSYEGQRVAEVELAGRPDLDTKELESVLLQKVDQPLSLDKVKQSIEVIKATGRVKDVQLEVRPQADGIRVMFVLQPAYAFGIYTFPGAERFAYSRILQVADYPPRGAYSPVDVRTTRENLQRFFQKNGFFTAKVNSELQVKSDPDIVNVMYHVKLGRKAKFGKVIFEGAPKEVEPVLASSVKSLRARIRGAAIRHGKAYNARTIEKATQFLESKLLSQSYLGSRVQLASTEYDPATNRADVHLKVTPGPQVQVRIDGAHVWSWTRRKLLPIYEQSGLDPELIQEGRQNLVAHFQSKGYFEVKVDALVEPSSIVYSVTKGQRGKVTDVDIVGNHFFSDAKLRPYIKIRKAGWIPFFSHGTFSQALVQQSTKSLEQVYQSEGFSSAKVTPTVTRSGGNIGTTFRIDEGPRDIVEALHVLGNNTIAIAQLAPHGLKSAGGQAYSAKNIDDDRGHILAKYLTMGYLNANFRASARNIDGNPHRLEVTYQINEGPRVTVDQVVTLGANSTKPSLLRQAVRIKTEAPMREDEMLAAENRLYSLGIFDWAQIDPRRQITTQDREDVLVKVHESRKNELQYGFGFEVVNRGGSIPTGTVALPGLPPTGLPSGFTTSQKTFWGPRGSLQYTRKNFRGEAESITVGLLAARLVQRAAFSYSDPFFAGAFWSMNSTLSFERNSENPIFTSRVGDFGFQVQRQLNAAGNKTLSLRYGFRKTSLTNLLIPDLVRPEDRNVRLSTLAAAYSYDTRDNPLDATKGKYQTLDFDINLKGLGSSADFARLRAQSAYYVPLPLHIVWANSVRAGVAVPFSGSRIPISELFFSGGGSTLRGFPLNGAGPQRSVAVCSDPSNPATCSSIQVPEGGRELFIINSEMRIPLPIKQGLSVVGFYDGGNVFRGVGFGGFFSDYTNTVGIGFRYKTPVGPVRLDLGHNLNAPPGIKSTQIFVTLGQSF